MRNHNKECTHMHAHNGNRYEYSIFTYPTPTQKLIIKPTHKLKRKYFSFSIFSFQKPNNDENNDDEVCSRTRNGMNVEKV